METIIIVAIIVAIFTAGVIFVNTGKPKPRLRQPADASRERDVERMNKGKCPDCGCEGTLLQGPSGGMSINVGCDACLMEFNVHAGFGTGAFAVDRNGKMSAGRAAVFGISPEEYDCNPNKAEG